MPEAVRVPWLVRLVWQPDVELDLIDKDGKPNHAKIVGFVGFVVDVILIALHLTPPAAIFIPLNAMLYGWVGYRTFLGSRTVTASEQNQNVHVEYDITKREGWDHEREYQAS